MAEGVAGAPTAAASISALIILPPGPEPLILLISTPLEFAKFYAIGLMKILSPDAAAFGGAAAAGVAGVGAAYVAAGAGSAALAGAGVAAAPASEKSANAAMSSLSSTRTASTFPRGISLVPASYINLAT